MEKSAFVEKYYLYLYSPFFNLDLLFQGHSFIMAISTIDWYGRLRVGCDKVVGVGWGTSVFVEKYLYLYSPFLYWPVGP